MKKDQRLNFVIEPVLLLVVYEIVTREQSTLSAYIRKCVVEDLKRRGKLTEEVLEDIT